jgi:signal transduction histidine kinase
MSRFVPRGLRGRLLLAFVVTSALTLAVAIAVVLGPLREQLREQSVDNLEGAVVTATGEFQEPLAQYGEDPFPLAAAAGDLRERTDARVLVANGSLTRPIPPFEAGDVTSGFLTDTDTSPPSTAAAVAALRAMRIAATTVIEDGDDVTVAVPLFGEAGVAGALVAERRLSEVTIAVQQVRNALLVAAVAGLALAVVLAVAFSNGLTRRLGRLRGAALRITADGPDAPAPRDDGRDEVGDLARTLARMQEELRRQEAARRSFVATASHELRTPLTMLQGTMELLEEDLANGGVDIDDAQRQVESARRELRRLSTLAGELLDLSRLDAAVQLRTEPVELGELARAVAAEFDVQARERGVEFEIDHAGVACWGRGDPDAVARVVRILLDNALRYGPDGGQIRVQSGCEEGRATITVADRGPGIPPDERERIFERFHRGRAARTAGGFGLGLAIGRELAERMGGELRLTDAQDGARFVLSLPESASHPAVTPA